MRREFHVSTILRLAIFCCLASVLLAACACAGPNTSSGNGNAGNAGSPQPAPSVIVATPESATNGQIEVVSTPPGATIILIDMSDGGAGQPQIKGSTPATISVKPGTYAVTLEKPGHKAYQKEVKVEANKTARLNARLR
jgi:hypothetical protein